MLKLLYNTQEKGVICYMNILVIGNGFDLAHGLPTKYNDFLEFCKMVSKIYESEKLEVGQYEKICLDESNLNKEIQQQLLKVFETRKNRKDINDNNRIIHTFTTDYLGTDKFYTLIKDNIWIDYFLMNPLYQKENWIDFESEISRVIQSLDNDMHGLSGNCSIDDDIENLSNNYLYKKYSVDTGEVLTHIEEITYKELRNKLLNDLNRLIHAFEIYLTEYVEKIDCKLVSPDIQKILPKESMKVNEMSVYDGCVLSFNYTNTYQRLYVDKKYIDYIHGKADINNTIETNNMVLGIDEYLGKKRRNKDIEFIAFKKYYQRIYKQTGSEYKRWVEIIKNQMQEIDDKIKNQYLVQIPYNRIPNKYRNQLYIFGHSLDVTDKDILRDLILNDNVYTTIFYVNKNVMGQHIANLVKVIGQDELIRRTGGSTKTIEFKQQQKMEPVKSQQSEENRA